MLGWGSSFSFAHSTITSPHNQPLFRGLPIARQLPTLQFSTPTLKVHIIACVCVLLSLRVVCKLQIRGGYAPFALLPRENKMNSFLATAVNIVCLLLLSATGLLSIFNKTGRRFLHTRQRDLVKKKLLCCCWPTEEINLLFIGDNYWMCHTYIILTYCTIRRQRTPAFSRKMLEFSKRQCVDWTHRIQIHALIAVILRNFEWFAHLIHCCPAFIQIVFPINWMSPNHEGITKVGPQSGASSNSSRMMS